MGDKPKGRHPSGRPIHRNEKRDTGFMRIVPTEPATPRLRQRELPSAIGFLSHIARDDGND